MSHRIIPLPVIADARGKLSFAQAGDQIPFVPRRVFYLYDLASDAPRGGHAHRAQHQFLLMLAGRCRVTVDDGRSQQAVLLDNPAQGLYVPPMLWLDLDGFSPNAVCLVLTSDLYDESDYVRDMTQFRQLTAR
ncbi:MAG TPA: FdtA/QdtA family cupin domain-containing protein [Rhizomicrobium sp.]|nr:FdtA/QdtA family cupin domain-containing protein [Rhizomicrobium sp.]